MFNRTLAMGLLVLTVLIGMVPVVQVRAQGLYEDWPPPPLGELTGLQTYTSVTTAAVGGSFSVFIEDKNHVSKTCFDQSDFPLTLVIDMPPNSVMGWVRVREYYPPGYNLAGDLFPGWRYIGSGGRQSISGITYTPGTPAGSIAWRIGLAWIDVFAIIWWTTQIQFWTTPCATPTPRDVTTQVTVTSSRTTLHPTETTTVTASVTPQVTGGTINVYYTTPKGSQTSICSQAATAGTVTCQLTPSDPGTGNLFATYSGYLDPTPPPGTNYKTSTSQTVAIQVEKFSTTIAVSATPNQNSIDILTGKADAVTIEVFLTREDGKPISEASVEVEIQGPRGTVTDDCQTRASGKCALPFVPTSAGTYAIRAAYAGDDQNKPSDDEGTLTVGENWSTAIILVAVIALAALGVFLFWRTRRRPRPSYGGMPGPLAGPRPIARPEIMTVPSGIAGQVVCFGCGKQFSSTLSACPNCGKPR